MAVTSTSESRPFRQDRFEAIDPRSRQTPFPPSRPHPSALIDDQLSRQEIPTAGNAPAPLLLRGPAVICAQTKRKRYRGSDRDHDRHLLNPHAQPFGNRPLEFLVPTGRDGGLA